MPEFRVFFAWLFMVMDDDFTVDSLTDEQAVLFDHTSADSHFGASVFWIQMSGDFGRRTDHDRILEDKTRWRRAWNYGTGGEAA